MLYRRIWCARFRVRHSTRRLIRSVRVDGGNPRVPRVSLPQPQVRCVPAEWCPVLSALQGPCHGARADDPGSLSGLNPWT
uniref:Uncharacterized protein n=1 Tax=Anopheles dirus TaxID=7168 RepID=A0A182NW58_9DIPT